MDVTILNQFLVCLEKKDESNLKSASTSYYRLIQTFYGCNFSRYFSFVYLSTCITAFVSCSYSLL